MIYTYGRTTVEVHDDWVETTLPDGTKVPACPNHDEESEARARSLGYSGVWPMTAEHDRFHALICHALGLEESPALRNAATGQTSMTGDIEEYIVLAVQHFMNRVRNGL